MSNAKKATGYPPMSRNNPTGYTGSLSKPPSRPPSRVNTNNSNLSSASTPLNKSSSSFSSTSSPPATSNRLTQADAPSSPSKERARMAGIRSDGVGGSHFKQKGDEESKIQVVVRVRGVAPGEAPPQRPTLHTEGPHCSSLLLASEPSASTQPRNVAVNSVQSSLVSDTWSNREKSYAFDHVFGPEADQGMVYQSAVGPVLQEVLSGYNCTVFAYGQTGTGKTHTMEGDLSSNVGTYSPEAGIIPRTLYRLFHTLDISKDEFSVHASFVELYNEELRDLLSDDAPQPLGVGSNSTGLRMYEDAKSRGIVIQGLEDVPMKDAEHGLRLLRKGSQKRHIAATKCNESSSRSHSVFTLTVHVKETTSKGEDVLRTGKLNLVDLAGSENIARSGAENKRAREAGMINQSLLTLGRVINALVDKSSHVPYRESKLTRLLQDSLGGKTKTCIIATVSSDRQNVEETLSTLDYALRAKSIRNRPEVNQRMTRAALIKAYVNEIERLKGDLLASREKNGIFLSPESWTAMQDEHDSTLAQVDELRRQSEVVESKMGSLREQFEQNMQLLVKRENEAKAIRAECKDKEDELHKVLNQFEELRQAVVEERSLRDAYMRSERRLDTVASTLQNLFQESTSDVGGLHAKLDRKDKIERRNQDLIAECQASLMSMSNQLEARVADFGSTHDQFTMDIAAQIREFQNREQEKLRANRGAVEQKLQHIQSLTRTATKNQRHTRDSIDQLVDAIRREGDILIQASTDRNEQLHKACQSLVGNVIQGHKDSLGSVRQGIEEMGDMLVTVLRSCKEDATKSRKALDDIHSMTNDATSRELDRLQLQNERLTILLNDEREKASGMRETLCKNIGQLVMNFCQQREQNMASIVDEVAHSNAKGQDDVQSFSRSHNNRLDEMLEENQRTRNELKEKERAAKLQRVRGESGLNQSSAVVERHLHDFTGHFFTKDQEGMEVIGATLHNISSNVDKIREHSHSSHLTKDESLSQIRTCAEEGFTDVSTELQSTLEDVEETCEGVAEGVEEHRLFGSTFLRDTNDQLGHLRNTTREYLSMNIQMDEPTGATPQKRDWPSIAPWSLVKKADSKLLLHAGDESMVSLDGDLADFTAENGKPSHDLEGKDHLQVQPDVDSAKATQSSKNRASKSGKHTIRPSLPVHQRAAHPLGERAVNRMSMNTRSVSGHSGVNIPSKLRVPSSTHAGLSNKKARQ